jgi:putative hydrolase of the HAD superfamily
LKTYQHIFFDLDHTLWDYDQNVKESLQELYGKYEIHQMGKLCFEDFFAAFQKINQELWVLFNQGVLDKDSLRKVRFKRIFSLARIDSYPIPASLEEEFVCITSSKAKVLPYSFDVLAYLKRKYCLHVITNGFNESQYAKLSASGLHGYFDLIVTSESSGYRKPDKRIFQYALEKLKANPSECLMIGDNPDSDILGAQNASIDQIYYNPGNKEITLRPTYTIRCLSEIKAIL